jgi:hypothetical protein
MGKVPEPIDLLPERQPVTLQSCRIFPDREHGYLSVAINSFT